MAIVSREEMHRLRQLPAKERREEVLGWLVALSANDDKEVAHANADRLLLILLDDPQIEEAWDNIDKWFA